MDAGQLRSCAAKEGVSLAGAATALEMAALLEDNAVNAARALLRKQKRDRPEVEPPRPSVEEMDLVYYDV
jgi:hypothetical protein